MHCITIWSILVRDMAWIRNPDRLTVGQTGGLTDRLMNRLCWFAGLFEFSHVKTAIFFMLWLYNIRIHHECECGIEKSAPRIIDWHHEACRVITNGDDEGRIFLSHPHTNNGFFFFLTTKYLIYIGKRWKKLPENPEYAEIIIIRCNMGT